VSTDDPPKNKRRAERIPLEKGTRGQLKSTLPVEILNLSETGLLLELASTLRPGSTYDITATLDGSPFAGLVRITRCRAGGFSPDGKGGRLLMFRAGGEFVGLPEKEMEGLRRVLSKRLSTSVSLRRIS
jgi:hypothetical protein